MKTTTCRGCGKAIVFATVLRPSGVTVKVPLDVSAPVYRVTGWALDEGEEAPGTPVTIERSGDAFVSHFATCPKASDFSGGRKKGS